MRPAHRRLEIDAARHQRRILRHEHVLEQQRARDRAAHAQRIPVADHGHAVGLGRYREVKRVAAGGFFAFHDLGAEHAVIIGVARKRSKDLLAVDDPAALDRLCLGAEGDAAGRGRAAFRERLRIDRAVVDDALVVHRAAALVLGAGGGVHVEIVGQRAGPQRRADMHVPGQRGRAAIAADLGGGQGIGLVVGAEAAMLPGNGDAEQAGAMQIPVILGREFRVAIVGRRAACEHGSGRARARVAMIAACSSLSRNAAGSKIGASRSILSSRGYALARLYRHHAVTCVGAAWAFRK